MLPSCWGAAFTLRERILFYSAQQLCAPPLPCTPLLDVHFGRQLQSRWDFRGTGVSLPAEEPWLYLLQALPGSPLTAQSLGNLWILFPSPLPASLTWLQLLSEEAGGGGTDGEGMHTPADGFALSHAGLESRPPGRLVSAIYRGREGLQPPPLLHQHSPHWH